MHWIQIIIIISRYWSYRILWIVSLWVCTATRRPGGHRRCGASWRWSGTRDWQRRTSAPDFYILIKFCYLTCVVYYDYMVLFNYQFMNIAINVSWKPFATSDEESFHKAGVSRGDCAWGGKVSPSPQLNWTVISGILPNIWFVKYIMVICKLIFVDLIKKNFVDPVSMNAMNIALSPLPLVGMRTCGKKISHWSQNLPQLQPCSQAWAHSQRHWCHAPQERLPGWQPL